MDDHEVERRLREALERKATEADVTAPVADRARRAAGAQRRTRWGVVAAAAAVVAAAVGVGVATQIGDQDGRGDAADESLPTEWRTEYWADIAVDVPADWGFGGAPDDEGTACFPEPMIEPDGRGTPTAAGLGYVGRPIFLTDVCALVPDAWRPTAPYVWLGAGIEPGIHEYAEGWVEETLEVNGTTVTVGGVDAAMRQQILGSVRGGEMCLSQIEAPGPIAPDRAADPGGKPVALRACVYRDLTERRPTGLGGFRGTATLVYATDLGRDALDDYRRAIDAARADSARCVVTDMWESEWVVLEMVDSKGAVQRADVVHLAGPCAGINVGAAELTEMENVSLTQALLAPWAVRGVRATLYRFIGPMG